MARSGSHCEHGWGILLNDKLEMFHCLIFKEIY